MSTSQRWSPELGGREVANKPNERVFFFFLSSLREEHVRPARCLSRLEAGDGPSEGGEVRGRFSREKWPTWLRGCYSLG